MRLKSDSVTDDNALPSFSPPQERHECIDESEICRKCNLAYVSLVWDPLKCICVNLLDSNLLFLLAFFLLLGRVRYRDVQRSLQGLQVNNVEGVLKSNKNYFCFYVIDLNF